MRTHEQDQDPSITLPSRSPQQQIRASSQLSQPLPPQQIRSSTRKVVNPNCSSVEADLLASFTAARMSFVRIVKGSALVVPMISASRVLFTKETSVCCIVILFVPSKCVLICIVYFNNGHITTLFTSFIPRLLPSCYPAVST